MRVLGISGKMDALVASKSCAYLEDPKNTNMTARSPEDVTKRLDRLIAEIREKYHAPVIGKPKHKSGPGDILIVAHGHILRAFAMRWSNESLQSGPTFLLEAGGIGTLR